MPEGVGYSFIEFELDQIAKELAQEQRLPTTPESIRSIKQAVMQNPALGASTPTGRDIAAQSIGGPHATNVVEEDRFVPRDFEAPGAQQALEHFLAQQQTSEAAPIDNLFGPGQAVDIGPGTFEGTELDGTSYDDTGNRDRGSDSNLLNRSRSRSAPMAEAPQQREATPTQAVAEEPVQSGLSIVDLINTIAPFAAAGGLSAAGNLYLRPPSTPNAAGLPIPPPATDIAIDNSISGDVVRPSNVAGEIGQDVASGTRFEGPPPAITQQPLESPENVNARVDAATAPIDDPLNVRVLNEVNARKNNYNDLAKAPGMFNDDFSQFNPPPLIDQTGRLPTNAGQPVSPGASQSKMIPLLTDDAARIANEDSIRLAEELLNETRLQGNKPMVRKVQAIIRSLRSLR